MKKLSPSYSNCLKLTSSLVQDEGALQITSLATSNSHLAVGSASGVVNLYSTSAIYQVCTPLKDQYGPRTFFLEFPFFAKNMIIKSILNLWWHSKILKLFLGVVRGIFTKRLKRTRRLLYAVKYDFFQMTALHSKC